MIRRSLEEQSWADGLEASTFPCVVFTVWLWGFASGLGSTNSVQTNWDLGAGKRKMILMSICGSVRVSLFLLKVLL